MPALLVRAGVLGRLGRLARMRAASALPPGRAGDQTPLFHDSAHGPLAGLDAGGAVSGGNLGRGPIPALQLGNDPDLLLERDLLPAGPDCRLCLVQ